MTNTLAYVMKHSVKVPAAFILPGDHILYSDSYGGVNRIETGGTNVDGAAVLVFPIHLTEMESRKAGTGWRFPRYLQQSVVTVFAPDDLGGRSALLRSFADAWKAAS